MALATESFRQKLDDLEALIEENDEKTDEYEKQSKAGEERFKKAVLEAENIRRKCASTKQEITLATAKQLKVNHKLVQLQSTIYKSERSTEDLQKKDDEKSDQLEDIENKLREEKEKHLEICSVYEEARSRKCLLENDLRKCRSQIDKKLEKKSELEKQLSNHMQDMEKMKRFDDEEDAEETMIEKVRQIQEKENAMQDKIQDLRNQITMMSSRVTKQQKKKEKTKGEMDKILHELESI